MHLLLALSTWILFQTALDGAEAFRSRPPVRPLPKASSRPLTVGAAYFVDARMGNDRRTGTKQAPWKTLTHALARLRPGDVLYLRGGTYYEPAVVKISGTKEKPITIRAYPDELVILDGGHRDFFEKPADSWEPFANGGKDEFRSKKSYKLGGGFGRFGDSMAPFQRYLTFEDLRSRNELWHKGLSNRAKDATGIYAGPGVRRDAETGRIHVRLSHTQLAGLGKHHYRGVTDPRKIPLVIAGSDYVLQLINAKHLRIQDLVIRGSQRSGVHVENCHDVELSGMTLYGSGSALRLRRCDGFRLVDCALQGHAAPWHSRGHHKDRAGAGYLVIAEGRNLEFARCNFTDHHDGIWMTEVDSLKIHHCNVDNFNDDGLEPGPKRKKRRIEIYQNRISRCLTALTAHGKKSDAVESESGSGVYVYRNVFDLRQGTYKSAPAAPDPTGAFLNRECRICSDHGSPTWAVYYVYHNTFLLPKTSWRGYYGSGWAQHVRGTTRRVFNNVFVQSEGLPGLTFPSVSDDFHADANLFWSIKDGPSHRGDFFAKFRRSDQFQQSKRRYPPGLGARDLFADPKLRRTMAPVDVRLRAGSPAIDAGIDVPKNWPDSLREKDKNKPDVGACPAGAERFITGPRIGTAAPP